MIESKASNQFKTKVVGSIPGVGPLCIEFPGSLASSHSSNNMLVRLIGDSRLFLSVNGSGNNCLKLILGVALTLRARMGSS